MRLATPPAAGPPLTFRQIAWLATALTVVILPHGLRLPLWETGFIAAVLLWRLGIARYRLAAPKRWVLLILTVAAGAAIGLSYGSLLGREPGVALLALMSALKLLELKGYRDGMVTVFLAYFLVITHFLYTQSIPIAVYMFLAVAVVTAALMALQSRTAGPAEPRRLITAGRIVVQSLPLMLVLFVLVPRVPGPLWQLPDDSQQAFTGLSDRMSPGSISELSRSGAVAFRATFEDIIPAPADRYWRGVVMPRFDGQTWEPARNREFTRRVPPEIGFSEPLSYTITLEPHGQRWLFALDVPARLPPDGRLTRGYTVRQEAKVEERKRYDTASYLDYWLDPELSERMRQANLSLPARAAPQTRALGERWAQELDGDRRAVIERALTYFRQQPFTYTLQPAALTTGDPTDRFLFETREGFCEHYASAFVLLMRAAGLPARVVTGYQGGEINPIGEYLIVRQSDAHAWAEVWLAEQGWVRVDPTGAVSPSRVEQGLGEAVGGNEPVAFLARREASWLRQAALTWDAVNNGWNAWVLGYGPQLQSEFLARFGIRDALSLGIALFGGIAFALGVSLGLGAWRRGRRRPRDPALRAYRRYLAKLRRIGLRPHTGESPSGFAERVAAERPDLGPQVRLITRLYNDARYGRHGSQQRLDRLRDRVRVASTRHAATTRR